MRKMYSAEDIVFEVIKVLFFGGFLFVTLYPLINLTILSFTGGADNRICLWPNNRIRDTYDILFNYNNKIVITALKNSFLRTVTGTSVSVVLNSVLAYIISRKRFLFRRSVSLFWIGTMFVNGGLVPTFLVMKWLGFVGSFWVYVIPGAVSAVYVFIIRAYMESISDSIEESAELDGAGYWTIFTRVISPLCKPVYATIALFAATYQWNAWFDAFIYNRYEYKQLTVVQYELMKVVSSISAKSVYDNLIHEPTSNTTLTSVVAAFTIVATVPVICVYPFFQKNFINAVKLGIVKQR